jgi:integrase
MGRQQLPPQIRKITARERGTGREVTRYQLTVDAGRDAISRRRRQVRQRFATEAEARAQLAKIQASVSTGTYVHTAKLTLDKVCEDWLLSKQHALKPATISGHRSKLAVLRAELGDMNVQKLAKSDLDGLVSRLRAGEVEGHRAWSPRSCNYLLHLTQTILDDQLAQGAIVRNVARLVDRVAGDPKTFRTLTDQEMFAILDKDSRDRHLWALALYGFRRGEIAGLRWEHVDLTAGSVAIAENRVAFGKQIEIGTPKSKASRRTLPLPAEVIELLKAAQERQAAERAELGDAYGPGEYVAIDEIGLPYHPNLLTFRWGRMLDGLGIERVRLHDARHSCATLMHLRGVPIAVVAKWLGHASAAFTMAVYTHSTDDALAAAGTSFRPLVTICDTETVTAV